MRKVRSADASPAIRHIAPLMTAAAIACFITSSLIFPAPRRDPAAPPRAPTPSDNAYNIFARKRRRRSGNAVQRGKGHRRINSIGRPNSAFVHISVKGSSLTGGLRSLGNATFPASKAASIDRDRCEPDCRHGAMVSYRGETIRDLANAIMARRLSCARDGRLRPARSAPTRWSGCRPRRPSQAARGAGAEPQDHHRPARRHAPDAPELRDHRRQGLVQGDACRPAQRLGLCGGRIPGASLTAVSPPGARRAPRTGR